MVSENRGAGEGGGEGGNLLSGPLESIQQQLCFGGNINFLGSGILESCALEFGHFKV